MGNCGGEIMRLKLLIISLSADPSLMTFIIICDATAFIDIHHHNHLTPIYTMSIRSHPIVKN
jgi:hypothetical protein